MRKYNIIIYLKRNLEWELTHKTHALTPPHTLIITTLFTQNYHTFFTAILSPITPHKKFSCQNSVKTITKLLQNSVKIGLFKYSIHTITYVIPSNNSV